MNDTAPMNGLLLVLRTERLSQIIKYRRAGQKGRNMLWTDSARFPHHEKIIQFFNFISAAAVAFVSALKALEMRGKKGENWASWSFFLTGKASNGRAHDDG